MADPRKLSPGETLGRNLHAVSGFIVFPPGRRRALDQSARAGDFGQVHGAVGLLAVPCVRVKCWG